MGGRPVSSNDRSISSHKRLLVCGLGSIGRRHVRTIHQHFHDIDISAYRSGKGPDFPEYSLICHQFYELEEAILWKPDAAIISSPAPFHQEQALSFARANIPVLIEKPLGIATDSIECWDELMDLSTTTPVVVGYVLRHDPCAEYVKKKLDSNGVGKILEADFYCGSWLPDWRSNIDYRQCVSSQHSKGGGALMELSHEIDLALWFLGDFQINYCTLRQSGLLDIDVEDQVLLVGSGKNCSQITIRLNFCSKPPRRDVVLRCEKGEIHWDLINSKVMLSIDDEEATIYNPLLHPDDRFRVQAERFMDTVYNSAPPYCSLNDGLAVMKLISQAHYRANHAASHSRFS